MPRLGPYSSASILADLDGRSRAARLLRVVRAELTAHVGGRPSMVQQVLIGQAAALHLQISLMDAKAAERGGVMSARDSRHYLSWCANLQRLLRQLGMKAAAATPRTLADHLATAAPAHAPRLPELPPLNDRLPP